MNDWGFSVDDPKKGARILQLTSFHHFIYSKKRLGLKRNLAFNQGTRKIFGALRSLGEGFWKFVGTSGKILATPLKNRACSLHPNPPPGGAPPRGPTHYPFIYHIWQKRDPFRIPSIDDGTHFTDIVYNFVSLLTAINVLPFKYEKITKPETFVDIFTTIQSFCSPCRS